MQQKKSYPKWMKDKYYRTKMLLITF